MIPMVANKLAYGKNTFLFIISGIILPLSFIQLEQMWLRQKRLPIG